MSWEQQNDEVWNRFALTFPGMIESVDYIPSTFGIRFFGILIAPKRMRGHNGCIADLIFHLDNYHWHCRISK